MTLRIPVHDWARSVIVIGICLCSITICVNKSWWALVYKSVPCASSTISKRNVAHVEWVLRKFYVVLETYSCILIQHYNCSTLFAPWWVFDEEQGWKCVCLWNSLFHLMVWDWCTNCWSVEYDIMRMILFWFCTVYFRNAS